MPAAPLLAPSSCLDLSVNTSGQVVAEPVVDQADGASALRDRSDGLYVPALNIAACVARATGLNLYNPAPSPADDAETWVMSYSDTDLDTDAMFDNASPTLITARTAGRYVVSAMFAMTSPTIIQWSEQLAGLGILLQRSNAAPELIAVSGFRTDNGLGASCSRHIVLEPGDQVRAVLQAWVQSALDAIITVPTGGIHQRAGSLSVVGVGMPM